MLIHKKKKHNDEKPTGVILDIGSRAEETNETYPVGPSVPVCRVPRNRVPENTLPRNRMSHPGLFCPRGQYTVAMVFCPRGRFTLG